MSAAKSIVLSRLVQVLVFIRVLEENPGYCPPEERHRYKHHSYCGPIDKKYEICFPFFIIMIVLMWICIGVQYVLQDHSQGAGPPIMEEHSKPKSDSTRH